MNKFEIVSRFNNTEINLPKRKTIASAGYDFEAAEDIIIPAYARHQDTFNSNYTLDKESLLTLSDISIITKATSAKPTLIPTGVKCKMDSNVFLQLSVRSSCPLKNWIILANGVGIIDSDYYNNPDNEGEIFFQVINLSPWNIQIKKGDTIGQGILLPYLITEDDAASGKRVGGFGSTDGNN